jgi:hypothetical protein
MVNVDGAKGFGYGMQGLLRFTRFINKNRHCRAYFFMKCHIFGNQLERFIFRRMSRVIVHLSRDLKLCQFGKYPTEPIACDSIDFPTLQRVVLKQVFMALLIP